MGSPGPAGSTLPRTFLFSKSAPAGSTLDRASLGVEDKSAIEVGASERAAPLEPVVGGFVDGGAVEELEVDASRSDVDPGFMGVGFAVSDDRIPESKSEVAGFAGAGGGTFVAAGFAGSAGLAGAVVAAAAAGWDWMAGAGAAAAGGV